MKWMPATRPPFAIVYGLIWLAASLLSLPLVAQDDSDLRLYFFTAQGCRPCMVVKPQIEAMHHEGYPVWEVDVNRFPQLANQFGITRTPTVILVRGGKQAVVQKEGAVFVDTMREWFASAGWRPIAKAEQPQNQLLGDQGTLAIGQPRPDPPAAGGPLAGEFDSPTMHQGTDRAATSAEQRALDATVRIRVETANAFSFGTGTVIHNHNRVSLVMTCGHLFRDSQDQSQITVEYDFQGQKKKGIGKLLSCDIDGDDLALIEIQTPTPIQPVALASADGRPGPGVDVFSIGCDRGADPTIRHSQIKAQGRYNGSLKYDIYGRPVIGRSGGGLFTESGELIGVCNLAVMNADEGVYSTLDNVHQRLRVAGLSHLFQTESNTPQARPERLAQLNPVGDDDLDGQGWDTGASSRMGRIRPVVLNSTTPGGSTTASTHAMAPYPAGDSEVLIIVRPRDGRGPAETITIDDPSPQLLNHLQRMKRQGN